jgi:hypothetical protein
MALIWSHTESEPGMTAVAAVQTAHSGTWESLDVPTRFRYLRILMILSLQVGLMTNKPPRPRGPEAPVEYGRYALDQFRDQQSLEIASVVLRTPQLVLPTGSYSVRSVQTTKGEGAITEGEGHPFDVGALPAVILVLGIAACAIATIVVAQIAGDVVDRQLTRSEDTKRLLGSQASAVQVLMDHGGREDKAGHAIPFTDTELAIISNLAKVQTTIAEKRQTPLPSPFGAAESLGNAAKTVTSGLEGLAPWAVAAGVAYWFFTSKGTRSEA